MGPPSRAPERILSNAPGAVKQGTRGAPQPLTGRGRSARIAALTDPNDPALPAARATLDARAHTLLDLVEAQVLRTPDARAVVATNPREVLTYAELHARASSLAGALRVRGIGLDSVVAVLLPRSVHLPVAMLAAMKAGAAYLPLDAGLAAERLEGMVADAGARAIVTTGDLRPVARSFAGGLELVCVEDGCDRARGAAPEGDVAPGGDATPAGRPAPLDVLAVFFTSGSTGRPRGVMVPHRGVVNRIAWMQEQFGLAPHERTLNRTNVTWDASIWEIFWPLTVGASVVVVDDEQAMDARRLASVIVAESVAVVDCAPLQMDQLVRCDELRDAPSLRLLLTGGESVPASLVSAHRRSGVKAPLWNSYGQTETSVAFLFCPLVPEDGAIPMGSPIPGTSAVLLDGEGAPVPDGTVGELYVGGVGVTRGYAGLPAATAERFVPDPAGPPGARRYRTGDFGRRLPSGNFEFAGRRDGQRKIRGYRVELHEVETALERHPGVHRAVVTTDRGPHDETRLVAYLTGDRGVTVRDLRRHLSAILPDHMIPSVFAWLDDFAVLPSGKVDLHSLPPAPATRPRLGVPHVPPQGGVEARVARIFEEELGVDGVGRDDDFWDLGGTSLAVTRVCTRIRDDLSADVAPRDFLRAPTVAALARFVTGPGGAPSGPEPAPSCLAVLKATGSAPPLFLAHPGGGTLFAYRTLVERLPRQVMGFEATGLDGSSDPMASVPEMASAYVRSMRAVQPEGPYALGGWSLGAAIAAEMAFQLEGCGAAVELVLLVDEPARDDQRAGGQLAATAGGDPGLQRMMDAHVTALRTFEPRPIASRVVLALAGDRPGDRDDEIRAWAELCSWVEPHVVAGVDHFSILASERLAAIVAGALGAPPVTR